MAIDTTSYLLGKKAGGGSGGTTNYNELSNKPQINNTELSGNKSSSDLGLQDKLISGTNIKTINDIPLLGEGNIQISGGGSGLPIFFSDTNLRMDIDDLTPGIYIVSKNVVSSGAPKLYFTGKNDVEEEYSFMDIIYVLKTIDDCQENEEFMYFRGNYGNDWNFLKNTNNPRGYYYTPQNSQFKVAVQDAASGALYDIPGYVWGTNQTLKNTSEGMKWIDD